MPPKRPSEGGQPAGGDATKRARMEGGGGGSTAVTAGGASGIQAQIDAAKAKAAAALTASKAAASKAAVTAASTGVRPHLTARGASNGMNIDAIRKQLEEAKRKLNMSAGNQAGGSSALSAQRPGQSYEVDRPPRSAIHPLLMDIVNRSKASTAAPAPPVAASSRPVLPKVADAGAAPMINPYLSNNAAEDEDGLRNRFRRRALLFNAPGRHIRAAEEARREAQMEALKRRIEEQARKAGLDELSAEERALRRQKPPGLEWWDQQFLPGQDTYEAVFDNPSSSKVLVIGDDSPIDVYIQHPIPLPAPSDKIKVEMKGVMLTKSEQKKMRRLRRRAEQEDKQDQIKMGLLPPDPPKVKLGNLMRVLTSEAVADPTKAEARVRRDVAARREKHDSDNHDRMLTPEQRKAKADEQKEKDLAKGVYTLVFKVRHLVSPSHKFKVHKNARQLGLTGLALFGKDFALVLVEGGHKGIKSYRHLMMERIKWDDPKKPKAVDGGLGSLFAEVDGTASASAAGAANGEGQDDEFAHIDWSKNYCRILFEGPIRDQHFTHGFRARQCEADIDAKQALGPKMASYWDLAKRDEGATEEEEQ